MLLIAAALAAPRPPRRDRGVRSAGGPARPVEGSRSSGFPPRAGGAGRLAAARLAGAAARGDGGAGSTARCSCSARPGRRPRSSRLSRGSPAAVRLLERQRHRLRLRALETDAREPCGCSGSASGWRTWWSCRARSRPSSAAGRSGAGGHVIRSIAEPAAARAAEPEAFLWVGRLAPYKRPLALLDLAERDAARALRDGRYGSRRCDPRCLAETVAARASALANVELLGPRPRHELARAHRARRRDRQHVRLRGDAERVPRGLGARGAGPRALARPGWRRRAASGSAGSPTATPRRLAVGGRGGVGGPQRAGARSPSAAAGTSPAATAPAAVASAWEPSCGRQALPSTRPRTRVSGSGDPEPMGELGVG